MDGEVIHSSRKSESKKFIRRISFRELILLLLGPDNESVLGFPMLFPDTAFFDDGKVTEIVKTDKDGFLVATKFESRTGIQDIRTTFTTIVRE